MSEAAAKVREQCLCVFRAGIAAADPRAAVLGNLQADHNHLQLVIDREHNRSGHWQNIHLMAFGKAACAMASAAREAIPRRSWASAGIVVTGYESVTALEGFEVLGAGHPLPDANGLHAAQTIAGRLQQARSGELVLLLISGGGSAMLPYPVDGVSLADKIATTQLLLASGATINQVNSIRKHLSRLKGGGMARLAAPADLHAMILSDVIGDDLSAIASGPTVADSSTFADAINICKQQRIWDKLPQSVQQHLQQGEQGLQPETLKADDPVLAKVSHSLIGSNALSVAAVCEAAKQQGYQTQVYNAALSGEAREVAAQWAADCKTLIDKGLQQATALIAGGETTVTLSGNGTGGRNQEMALAFALTAERLGLRCRWTFLSAGTDGRDGPTDAAGGIVDQDTVATIRLAGIDPQAALANNDSYHALRAANALVLIGATGTNVADLQILLLHPLTE